MEQTARLRRRRIHYFPSLAASASGVTALAELPVSCTVEQVYHTERRRRFLPIPKGRGIRAGILMNGWEDFFVGELGAAAALTGLVFVGISINLNKIMASPYLPNDALEALTALVAVLFITSLMLIPDQSLVARGIAVLLGGLVYWVVIVLLQINTLRTVPPTYRNRILRIIVVYQLAAPAVTIQDGMCRLSG